MLENIPNSVESVQVGECSWTSEKYVRRSWNFIGQLCNDVISMELSTKTKLVKACYMLNALTLLSLIKLIYNCIGKY